MVEAGSGPRHEVREAELRPGARVVVRHRLPDGSASDALGELVSATAAELEVATRRGPVRIARADVLAAKAVPPPPQRRGAAHRAVGAADLERVMAAHWRAAEAEPLGEWLLRASGGFTNRANSCLAVGSAGADLPAALERVRGFYAARALPAVVAVPHPVPVEQVPDDAGGDVAGDAPDDPVGAAARVRGAVPGLDAELAAAGWGLRTPTLVLTAATRRLAAAPREPLPAGLVLDLAAEPDAGWLEAYRYRGQPLPAGARGLLLSADAQVFASVRAAGGRTVAVARGSWSPGWAGVMAVEVDPAHRRRGLGRALLAALADWAHERGAASTFLQVAADNGPAVRLYAAAGLTVHHGYRYRTAP